MDGPSHHHSGGASCRSERGAAGRTEEIVTFQMPGGIVPGFNRNAAQMVPAGFDDLRIDDDDTSVPLVRLWGVFEVEGLDPDGERAREQSCRWPGRVRRPSRPF